MMKFAFEQSWHWPALETSSDVIVILGLASTW